MKHIVFIPNSKSVFLECTRVAFYLFYTGCHSDNQSSAIDLPSLGISALTDISKGEKTVFRAFVLSFWLWGVYLHWCAYFLIQTFGHVFFIYILAPTIVTVWIWQRVRKKIAPFKVYSKCLATNTRSSYIRNTLSNAELAIWLKG